MELAAEVLLCRDRSCALSALVGMPGVVHAADMDIEDSTIGSTERLVVCASSSIREDCRPHHKYRKATTAKMSISHLMVCAEVCLDGHGC